MQHLGWLAEKVIDVGGTPVIEHIEVDRSTRTADMLSADVKIEQEVADAYDQAAAKADDPKTKKLFIRLRDNEIYHAEVFSDLLAEEEKSD